MEVILKEDVAKLGARGEVVKVAEGYGRNYLLPRKLAIEASKGNKSLIEQMKAASLRRWAKEKTQAEELAKQFDGVSLTFERRSGENDQLFGLGYLRRHFRCAGKEKLRCGPPQDPVARTTPRRWVEFTISIKLHKDVTTHVKVIIEKEKEVEWSRSSSRMGQAPRASTSWRLPSPFPTNVLLQAILTTIRKQGHLWISGETKEGNYKRRGRNGRIFSCASNRLEPRKMWPRGLPTSYYLRDIYTASRCGPSIQSWFGSSGGGLTGVLN